MSQSTNTILDEDQESLFSQQTNNDSHAIDPRHHLGPRESADHLFASSSKRKSSPTQTDKMSQRSVVSSSSSTTIAPRAATPKTSSSNNQVRQRQVPRKKVVFNQQKYNEESDDVFSSQVSTPMTRPQQQQQMRVSEEQGQLHSSSWSNTTSPSSNRRIRLEQDLEQASEAIISSRHSLSNNKTSTTTTPSKTRPIIRASTPVLSSSVSSKRNPKDSTTTTNKTVMVVRKPSSSSVSPTRSASPPPTKLPCVAHPTYTGHKDCGCLIGWSPSSNDRSGGNNTDPYANLPPVVVHKQKVQSIGPLEAAPRLRLIAPHISHQRHQQMRGGTFSSSSSSVTHFPTVLTCETGSSEIWERHTFSGECISTKPFFSLLSSNNNMENDGDVVLPNEGKISAFCSMGLKMFHQNQNQQHQQMSRRKQTPSSSSVSANENELLWIGCDGGSIRAQINNADSRQEISIEPLAAHKSSVAAIVPIPEFLSDEISSAILTDLVANTEHDDETKSMTTLKSTTAATPSGSVETTTSTTNYFPLAFSASTDGQLKALGIKKIETRSTTVSNAKKASSFAQQSQSHATKTTTSYKIIELSVASHISGFRCMTLLDLSPEIHVSRNPSWILCAGCNDGVIKCWSLEELIHASQEVMKERAFKSSFQNHHQQRSLSSIKGTMTPSQSRSTSLATNNNNNTTNHHDIFDIAEPVFTLKGHSGAVRCIVPVRSEIEASSSFDRFSHQQQQAQNIEEDSPNNTNNINNNNTTVSKSIIGVRRELWTGSDDKTIKVWSIPSLQEPASLRSTITPSTSGHRSAVCSLSCIKWHTMWSTDEHGRISIFKLDTLQLVHADDEAVIKGGTTRTQQLSRLHHHHNQHLPSVTAILPLAGHIVWLSASDGSTNAIYVPGSLPKSNIDPQELAVLQDQADEVNEKMEHQAELHRFELEELMVQMQTRLDDKFGEFSEVLSGDLCEKEALIEGYAPNVAKELNQEFINLLQDAKVKIVELQTKNTELQTSHNELEKISDENEKAAQSSKSKLKELSTSLNDTKKKLQLAEGRFIKTRDDLARETSRGDRLENERPRLQQTAEAAEQKASEQQKRAVGAEAKIRGLKEETTRAQQKANLLDSQSKKFQETIADLTERLNDQTKKTTELEDKNKRLGKEKKEDAEKMTKLNKDHSKLQNEHLELEKSSSDLSTSLQEYKSKLKSATAELETTKEKFTKIDDERLQLRMDLRNAKVDIEKEKSKFLQVERKVRNEAHEEMKKLKDQHEKVISDLKEKHYQEKKSLIEEQTQKIQNESQRRDRSDQEERDKIHSSHSVERNRLQELTASAEERASRQAMDFEKRIRDLQDELDDENKKRKSAEMELAEKNLKHQEELLNAAQSGDDSLKQMVDQLRLNQKNELERLEKQYEEKISALEKETKDKLERASEKEKKLEEKIAEVEKEKAVLVTSNSENETASQKQKEEDSLANSSKIQQLENEKKELQDKITQMSSDNNNNNSESKTTVSAEDTYHKKTEEREQQQQLLEKTIIERDEEISSLKKKLDETNELLKKEQEMRDFVEPSAPSSPVSPSRITDAHLSQESNQKVEKQLTTTTDKEQQTEEIATSSSPKEVENSNNSSPLLELQLLECTARFDSIENDQNTLFMVLIFESIQFMKKLINTINLQNTINLSSKDHHERQSKVIQAQLQDQLQELQKTADERLKAKESELQQQMETERTENDKKIKELESKLDEEAHTSAQRQRDTEDTTLSKISELEQQHKENVENLRDQLDHVTGQRNALIRESETMKTEFEDMVELMKKDLEHSKTQLAMSGSEQIAAAQKQYEELKENSAKKIKKLSKDLDDSSTEIEKVQKALEKEKQIVRELAPKAMQAEEERDKHKKNFIVLKKEHEEYKKKTTERLEETTKDLHQVRTELDALNSKLSSTQSHSGQQETELTVANKKVVSLTADFDGIQTELRELHDLKTQLARHKDAYKTTKTELDLTQKDLEDTRSRLDSFRNQMDSLHEDYDNTTKELEEARTAAADYQKTAEISKKEMENAKQKASETLADAQEKFATVSSLKQEKDIALNELSRVQSDLQTTTSERDLVTQKADDLEKQLTATRNEHRNTKETLEKTAEMLSSTRDILKELQTNHKKLKQENEKMVFDMSRSADEVQNELRQKLEQTRISYVQSKQSLDLTTTELKTERENVARMARDRDESSVIAREAQMKLDIALSKHSVSSQQVVDLTQELETMSYEVNGLRLESSQKSKDLEAANFALRHARGQMSKTGEESLRNQTDLHNKKRELEKKNALLEKLSNEFQTLQSENKIISKEHSEMKYRIEDYEEMEKEYLEMKANEPPIKEDNSCQTDMTFKDVSRMLEELNLRQDQVRSIQLQLKELLDSGEGDEDTRAKIKKFFNLDPSLFPHNRLDCYYCNGCLCLRQDSSFKTPTRHRANPLAVSNATSRLSRESLRTGILPSATELTARDDFNQEMKNRNRGLPKGTPRNNNNNHHEEEDDYDDGTPSIFFGSSSSSPRRPALGQLVQQQKRNQSTSPSSSSSPRRRGGKTNNGNNPDDQQASSISSPAARAASSPVGSPTNPSGERQLKKRLNVLIRAFNHNKNKGVKFELTKEITRLRNKLAVISPEYANAELPEGSRQVTMM